MFRTLDAKKGGVLQGHDARLFNEKLLKLKVMDLDAEAIADLQALADGEAGISMDSFTAVVLRGEQRQQFELRSKVNKRDEHDRLNFCMMQILQFLRRKMAILFQDVFSKL